MLFEKNDENFPVLQIVTTFTSSQELNHLQSKSRETPSALHPNAQISGPCKNTKDLGVTSKLPNAIYPFNPSVRRPVSSKFPVVEEEICEASDTLENKENIHIFDKETVDIDDWPSHAHSVRFSQSRTYVEPHMTEPLPNVTHLDLSILSSQKAIASVANAVPLASVWEFNSCEESNDWSESDS